MGRVTPRLPQPDFLRPVRRPGRLAWAACVTGGLVLAVAALDSQQAWQDRAQALHRLAQARQPSAPPLAADTPAARPGGSTARHWQQRLASPWPAVWLASETASTGGVAWLGLAHGERGLLQLDGVATDAGAALAAAQALRDQRDAGSALWRDVLLTRIEKTPDGQRFEIVAQRAGPPGAAP